jgi:hypothetical protein
LQTSQCCSTVLSAVCRTHVLLFDAASGNHDVKAPSKRKLVIMYYNVCYLQVDPATGKDEMVGYANAFTWGDLLHLDTVQVQAV